MTVKLIPDKGNGVTVTGPATVKRVGCEVRCPRCRVVGYAIHADVRNCPACKIAWNPGTWCYLVELTETEAASE